MRRVAVIASLVAVFVAGLFLAAGCSPLERVSAERFLAASEHIAQAESLNATQFIGATRTRAYLERWEMRPFLGARTRVLWVPLAELPAAVLEKLRNEKQKPTTARRNRQLRPKKRRDP